MAIPIIAPNGVYDYLMPAGTWFTGGQGEKLEFTFTPRTSGTVVIDTAATLAAGPFPSDDTRLFVSSDEGGFGGNDDGENIGARSRMTFQVEAGVDWIASVEMYPGSVKTARLGLHYSGPPTGPWSIIDVTVTAVTETTVELAWTGPVDPVPDGYLVAVNGNPPVNVGAVSSYSVTGLTPDTAYTFTVTGYQDIESPGPTVVAGQASEAYGSEPASNAFDTNPATHWTTNGNPVAWLRATLAAAAVVSSYSIRRRDDIPSRNPKAWTWEGSNDGTSWTVIETRTNVTWPTPGETKTFTPVPTAGAYLYYRINITANNGDSSYTSVSTLTLTGPPFDRRALTPPAPVSARTEAGVSLETDSRFWTSVLAASVGLDPTAQPVVEVRTWTGAGWIKDASLSLAAAGYTVTYGRSSATGPADPLQATLTLATALVPATPTIGTRLQISLCDTVATALGLTPNQAIRFTGEVTDPQVSQGTGLTRLTLVGRLGRANRLPIDGTSWPVDDDGTRVFRILTATGIGLAIDQIDPGDVPLGTPARVEPAGRMLERAIASTGGQLVEQPAGDLDWHNSDHRRGVLPSTTLPASRVFRDITWAQRVGDLVNTAAVAYQGGTIDVTDPSSADPVAGYGPYPASIDTDLTTESDAYSLGTLLIGRRSEPAWQLPDLTVDLTRTIPVAQLPALLKIRHGDRLELAGLPAGCPVPPEVIVEGYTETATPFTWLMSVSVSDKLLSGVSLRWIDVPDSPAYRWIDVDPSITWLDVSRIELPAQLL